MEERRSLTGALRPALIGGVLSGLIGALLFATAHALIIVPIWGRMWSGLLWGALAGLAAAWALAEIVPAVFTASAARVLALGAGFGGFVWLLVTPVTFVEAVLRRAAIAEQSEYVRVVIAVTLAIVSGGAFAWWRTRLRRAAIAGALATLLLTVSMAGPVPIARSSRALWIFLAVLPVCVIAGAVLAVAVRHASRFGATARSHRSPS